MKRSHLLWTLSAVLAALVHANTCAAQAEEALPLDRLGVMYVGGRVVEMTYPDSATGPVTGSSQWIEQAMVHYFLPRCGRNVPIVMVPGLNLSGYIYLATPDGRKGWAQIFAERGFDVYVFSDPLTSISGGFDVSPFNAAKKGDVPAADQSDLRLWSMEEVWSRWGFGSAYGVPYPDVRFPIDHIGQFYAGFPVRHDMPDGSGRFGSNFKAATLVELLEQFGCPAILMGHSAGGDTVVKAARLRPDLLMAFILLEPVGVPGSSDFPDFAGTACLGVYADYVEERGQTARKTATAAACELFSANGGVGGLISLPEDHGIYGNTHIMMQDNNNEVIADLMIDWLDANGVTGPYIAPTADLNGDCEVNLQDLSVVGDQWLLNAP